MTASEAKRAKMEPVDRLMHDISALKLDKISSENIRAKD